MEKGGRRVRENDFMEKKRLPEVKRRGGKDRDLSTTTVGLWKGGLKNISKQKKEKNNRPRRQSAGGT